MSEEHTVKETKEALEFLILLAGAVARAKSDGKIGLEDLGELVPLAKSAYNAYMGSTVIPKELQNLNGEEADQIAELISRLTKEVVAAVFA